MRRILPVGSGLCAGMLLAPLLLWAGSVQAQEAPHRDFRFGWRTGIGYAPVVPDVLVGAGVWRLFGEGRFGAFADVKITLPSITGHRWYCPAELLDCRVPWVERERNDIKMRDIEEFLLGNLGAMIVLTPEFAFLMGGGAARRSLYREFFHDEEDQVARITDSGGYYVPHDPAASWEAQWVVGMLIRMGNRAVVRFGYESAPGGGSLGGYLTFPW